MERKGLDISAYQKGISFNAIKNAGIEFLIVSRFHWVGNRCKL